MPPEASALLTGGFAAFAVTLAAVVAAGVRFAVRRSGLSADTERRWVVRAVVLMAAWMGVTWWVAASGRLASFDRRPPPLVVLLLSIFVIAGVVGLSRVGGVIVKGVPLVALVGLQGFRLPLELLMHRAYVEGVMPVQMSYSGSNFDIVSGATAFVVAVLLARGAPRWLASAWNLLGTALLANILVIAIRSTPIVAAYGPDRLNTWVLWPPFVWLPAVMVLTALTGHLLVLRALMTRP